MKLANALSILNEMRLAVQFALLPTLFAIMRHPGLLLQPHLLSQQFMFYVWVPLGETMNDDLRPAKKTLITPHAHGIVLDIGAGLGHTIDFLDFSKVTKYVALEPNASMHPKIRARAAKRGISENAGTLLILPYGVEQASLIRSALPDGVDTMVSVLVLCSITPPESSAHPLSTLVLSSLKPGGQFLFCEHVLSERPDVAWWQRFWTPLWTVLFDGCRLDRPSHEYIRTMKGPEGHESMWSEGGSYGDEEEENMLWHHTGRYVKVN